MTNLVHRHTINGAEVPLVHRLLLAIDEVDGLIKDALTDLGDIGHNHPMAKYYWSQLNILSDRHVSLSSELLAERQSQ